MEDAFLGGILGIGFISLLVVAAGWGGSISDEEWARDCKTIGIHRYGDTAFQCKLDARQPAN